MTLRGRTRLAVGLWLILSVVVWNVVFDRAVVLAGRRYSRDATVSLRRDGVYLRIDDVMRPAVARGAVVASAASLPIALFGVMAVMFAARRVRRGAAQADIDRWEVRTKGWEL